MKFTSYIKKITLSNSMPITLAYCAGLIAVRAEGRILSLETSFVILMIVAANEIIARIRYEIPDFSSVDERFKQEVLEGPSFTTDGLERIPVDCKAIKMIDGGFEFKGSDGFMLPHVIEAPKPYLEPKNDTEDGHWYWMPDARLVCEYIAQENSDKQTPDQ